MNKRLLVLLPIALLTLTGCNKDGSKDKSGDSGDTPAEGGGSIEMDFTQSMWKDEQITPYIETGSTEVKSFEYGGYTFNDCGSYANTYNGKYWLQMKNKDTEAQAFISNKTAASGAITKVEVTVNAEADGASPNATYRLALGSSEFTAVAEGTVKDEKKGAGLTLTVTADKSAGYKYFLLANINVGTKKYNGQILKVKVTVE